MYTPATFATALALTILSTVCWGSWANSFKGTRDYPFTLFYWDYIVGLLASTLVIAATLGSHGARGEPFLQTLRAADPANLLAALVAGAIFNVANILLVAAVDIAGLAVSFPLAIGIAVVEGVVLSYALQPKGSPVLLGAGLLLAIVAVLFDARAYGALDRSGGVVAPRARLRTGVVVSVAAGVLMGGFAPFVTRAMTQGHPLTPYGVSVLFGAGAFLCCLLVNPFLMRRPIVGAPVSFTGYRSAGARNHLLGLVGGVVWGVGGCLNFVAASYVGVPIAYAIGQSAPLIAAAWGVIVWREFAGAPARAKSAMALTAVCYVAAIGVIAFAYRG